MNGDRNVKRQEKTNKPKKTYKLSSKNSVLLDATASAYYILPLAPDIGMFVG